MTGIELIAAERKRQIEVEGWTSRHDDWHKNGEMARLAALYATRHVKWRKTGKARTLFRMLWPSQWARQWWKPRTPIANLVRAGALIAAELDRLARLEAKKP